MEANDHERVADHERSDERSWFGRRLADEAANPRTIVAVLALTLYSVLRVSYEAFYGPLGLSPEDLGLGYLELLAQAAIGIVAIAAVITMILGGAALTERAMVDMVERSSLRPWQVGFVYALGLLALAIGIVVTPADSPVFLVSLGGLGLLSVSLFIAGVPSLLREAAGGKGIDERKASRSRSAVLGLLILGLGLASASFIVTARHDSMTVRAGFATQPRILGLRLASWGAEPATISWITADIDKSLRSLTGECLLYLGQADGTVFLLRPTRFYRRKTNTTFRRRPATTFRIPTSTVSVGLHPSATFCRAFRAER